MRRLSPSYIVTSVAIALASTAALAQLRIQAAPGASPTTSSTTTAAGATATTSGTGSTATPTAASSGATASQPFTPEFVNNDAANAPFRTTPNTPDAMPTGAALGRSPGQTSSGTAAGNSSSGIDAGSQNLGTVNPSGTNLGNTELVQGVAVGGTTGFAGTASGGNANGERSGNVGGSVAASTATTPTPIFDLTARQGAEREARRRERGEEPRVYGIAPRTDRDLTRQMPDDPIIRY